MVADTDAIVEATVSTLLCVLSIIGNTNLFMIVYNNKTLQTTANYYILSLAAADLLVTSVSGPIMVAVIIHGDWFLGERACVAFGYITITTFIAFVANLTMITVHRYIYIVHWKKYKLYFTTRRLVMFGASAWLFALTLSAPPLLGWGEYGYVHDQRYCFVLWSSNLFYMYFTVIICFFGPLLTMAVCYYKILMFTRTLRKRLHAQFPNGLSLKKPGLNPGNQFRGRELKIASPEESKITHTLLIVVVCFMVSWALFAVTIFLNVYLPGTVPRRVNMWSLILGYVNSTCNPAIYGIRNAKIRKGFRDMYVKCRFRRRRYEHNSRNTTSQRDSTQSRERSPINFRMRSRTDKCYVISVITNTQANTSCNPMKTDTVAFDGKQSVRITAWRTSTI